MLAHPRSLTHNSSACTLRQALAQVPRLLHQVGLDPRTLRAGALVPRLHRPVLQTKSHDNRLERTPISQQPP